MSNQEQIDYWNGDAGARWARNDAIMERLLRPVTEALLDHAGIDASVASALDVGCGGGSQSLLLAQRLGPNGRVVGVDISAPMLAVAEGKRESAGAQSARLSFLQADASRHPFEPASFDLLFSRFGVMFFDDPAAAFSHLRPALRDGGRFAFCCWQSLKENPWAFIPFQAALRHVPPPEKPDPHAPGPFAFADPERVAGLLSTAGFADVRLESFNAEQRFGEADTLGESVRGLAELGPISRLLADQPDAVRERVFTSMEEALEPYYRDGALVMPTAIWFVTARAG